MFEPFERETITTDAGTFRVNYHTDDDPMSPREGDNLSVLVIDTPRSLSIDETTGQAPGRMPWSWGVREVLRRVNDEDVSTAAACRYLRAVLDAWAVVPLYVHEDWAPSVSVVDADARRGNGTIHGFVFDTPERRAVMGPESPEQAATWLREDVAVFSRYTEGRYVFFTVERLVDPLDEIDTDDEDAMDAAAWDTVDSLGSIDDLDYAREAAREIVAGFTPADFPSPVLAIQV